MTKKISSILSCHKLNFMQKIPTNVTILINCDFKILQNLQHIYLRQFLCPPNCRSQTQRLDFHTLLPSNDRVLGTWRLIFCTNMQPTNNSACSRRKATTIILVGKQLQSLALEYSDQSTSSTHRIPKTN